jgi:3-oxoadipate enol-lactonase
VTSTSANLLPIISGKTDADRYFTADGARLRYRDTGRGPVVLLVHGWTLDLEMWEPQVAALRDDFRLVRFDRRGFGLSSGRPSVAQDIQDIASLCQHLAIERAALIGMSQGVRAAMGFALTAAAKISCLILDGPPDPGNKSVPTDDDVPLEHFRAVVRAGGMGAFRREWAAHPLLSLRTGDASAREILGSMIDRYPGNDLLDPPVNVGVPATATFIGSIDVPVLIITGEHDIPSRTQAANRLAEQSANAVRAVIAAAGHLPNLDNPQLYNTVVRTFLERHAVPLG